jgi:hypothetical protein
LKSGQNDVGTAARGTGGAIGLPTGPIAADTTFTVVAARLDRPDITAVLRGQATVKIAV